MNTKNAVFATTAATFAITAMLMLGVLNYDSINFYQSDLDAAHAKLRRIENKFEAELDISFEHANEMTKKTAQYAELERLYTKYAINPEQNVYLKPKIDSLTNVIDSLKHDFFVKNHSKKLDKLNDDYKKAIRKVVMLQHDSVVNDSINNQPMITRFKKNWNEIFSKQR